MISSFIYKNVLLYLRYFLSLHNQEIKKWLKYYVKTISK